MAIEQIAVVDGASLMALSVPAQSRVLVVGSSADLDARLEERGCNVSRAESVDKAAAEFAGAGFDAVVLAEGFEHLGDPVGALRDAVALVGDTGTVVFAAPNAGSARARVRAFLGDTSPTGALPPRQYDLAGLEHAADLAGLRVVDRLRVFEQPMAPDDTDVPAAVLEHANAALDAHTEAFVIVASTAAGESLTKPTLAESLQAQVDAAARKVLRADIDRAEFEAQRAALTERIAEIETELAAARNHTADNERELATRADALVERIDTIDRLHTERRHLELDVAVKNDYIADLRTELSTWQDLYYTLRGEYDDLLRSRHYRAAAGMHKALTQIPLVHRLVTGLTRRVAKYVRPAPPPVS